MARHRQNQGMWMAVHQKHQLHLPRVLDSVWTLSMRYFWSGCYSQAKLMENLFLAFKELQGDLG